jgi:hypothetical protein
MSRANFTKIADQIEKDGYERGYRQAVKDMRRLLGGTLDSMLKAQEEPDVGEADAHLPLEPPSPPHTYNYLASFQLTDRGPSAQDLVLNMIKTVPGQRGSQIVSRLAQAGTPVEERTVRTALWRLKKRNLIEQRGVEWYALKPAFAPTMMEED